MPSYVKDFAALLAAYESGFPLSRAAAQVGVSANTASTWMQRAGVKVKYRRTNSEGGVGSLQHVCDQCGKTYLATHAKSLFCSRECTHEWRRAHGTKTTPPRAPVDQICPCGEKIIAIAKSGAPYPKKYCSAACRKEYAVNGRQKDPANYVTFTCQNETCDKEVTRYRKYGNGASKYCSNACAVRHTKKKHHIVLRDDDVVLDSTWEGLFYCMARFAKIPIERYDRQHGVQWGDSPNNWYAPDFWMPEVRAWKDRTGVAIEVKGHQDVDDETKWTAFRATGVDLVVMNQYRMEHLSAHGFYDTVRLCMNKDN